MSVSMCLAARMMRVKWATISLFASFLFTPYKSSIYSHLGSDGLNHQYFLTAPTRA